MLNREFLSQGGPNPITFVAAAQGSTSTTSLVINKPTGTLQNDLMVVFIYTGNGASWTQPTGWTEVADTGSIAVAYKTAGASEGSSYTFTASKSGTNAGVIVTYRNAAYDVVGTVTTSTSSPLSIPAITLSANASTVLAYVAASSTSSSWSTPTGFSSLSAMTTPVSFGTFGKDNVSSGSTGTVSTTRTGQGIGQAAVLVGIKPS